MTAPPHVRVHIDTLVVHGINGVSREALGAAVRHGLEQHLAATDTAAWHAGHRERVDGGSFDLNPAASAHTLGGQIAAAVQHGITTQPPSPVR